MKRLICLFGLMICVPAVAKDVVAEDTEAETVVVERMSCTDMQARIKELSDVEDDSGDIADEIATLTKDYRRMCMKSAAKRRASTVRTPVKDDKSDEETADEEEQVVEEEVVAAEIDEEVAEESVPELTPEQELENLDAGLCADGTKPNRFGCCGDEIFKDLGNTVFACCPRGDADGDCFPPIN